MKKISFFILAGLTVFSLAACGDDSSDKVTVTSESKTEESKKTETKEESEVGARSNPVPLGQTATFDTAYFVDGGEQIKTNLSITLSNVVRGEEAYNYLLSANQFNEVAPEGKEWVIFDVSMKMNSGSQDKAMYVMASFTPIASTGEEVPQDTYGTLAEGESFGLKDLYEGGTMTGKEAMLIPVGDDTLIKYTGDDFSTTVFFSLK
ncbi:lipoprotein [Candidatus Enterococcus clewellii]|uniref:DUF4352 domain-containing protein n=1 Tax=Candidatus Enterococcus clewellii TaxID=1834193 RepID=A0A242K4Y8_9ENTE|nr:hypothetical protein [Enterococcus sp. 9E7_DIV0242]OTP13682.1 hypothetical protein A5888_003160 [Enterococcus sp. 9E7_DIV0242]